MNFSYLKSRSGMLKLNVIILVVTAFALVRGRGLALFGDTVEAAKNNSYFGVGMLTAAMVVTPLLLAVYLSGKMDVQESIFEPVVNALFGVSFVVYGGLMLAFYSRHYLSKNYELGMCAGSVCLIAGVGYLVDLFFSIKNFRA